MRITGAMMANGMVRDINQSLARLQRAEQMLSSGKRINLPEDDPTATLTSMQLNSTLIENGQYAKNADQATAWLDSTDAALGEIGQVIQRTRELALRGANGTMEASSRKALADEVAQLYQHALNVANATHNGRYIFGGRKTFQPPFAENNDLSSGLPLVDYQGGDKPLVFEIGVGVSMDAGVPGDNALLPVFEAMRTIHQGLIDGDTQAISDTGLTQLDSAFDRVIRLRSEVGAKMNRLQISSDRLHDLEINLRRLLSESEDTDVVKVIMELKTQEATYRTALNVGARVIQPTLIDFLR